MNWFKKIINKMFNKFKVQTNSRLQEPSNESINSRDNYITQLKSLVNPEQDDKNGYGIQPKLSLKDMV